MNKHDADNHNQTLQLPEYSSILLAVDSSDHANHGTLEAVGLAEHFGCRITATHVYAAKLHDTRFRQMEGGLPEQFREEQELERQRDVHDDLITRGLSIITEAYLDQVASAASRQKLNIQRRALEGKNYRQLVNECNSGDYDLLVIGALGLGAVTGSRLGTVCQRTCRRSQIDTLVIREPGRKLNTGPLVVGVDGSAKSYGGLLTALSLARLWQVPVKVISAFDPYYHYVAFNRIAGVLSAEAGQVFRFQEQEKLHEEIIDSGLAKIYQGHLAVARSIAADFAIEIETVLLDGKPHEVMTRYLHEVKPSLLVLGTTGIHADDQLDIGGNSEYLLHDAPCSVLLSQREHTPQVDRLAEITTSWTNEAEARMERVPSFVRPMARMAILRYAQERGHTVITESIVQQATAELMPQRAEQAMQEIVTAYDQGKLKQPPADHNNPLWSDTATRLLLTIKPLSLRGNLAMRAEKRARSRGAKTVETEHLQPFLEQTASTPTTDTDAPAMPSATTETPAPTAQGLHWQAAALARLMRVPEGFMRDSAKQRTEALARSTGQQEISLALTETALTQAREAMQQIQAAPDSLPPTSGDTIQQPVSPATQVDWQPGTQELLDGVPEGFSREMTRRAIETIAQKNALGEITAEFVRQVMDTFQSGSDQAQTSMPWQAGAQQRIARAPQMVRGMLVSEIEGWCRRQGLTEVTVEAVEAVKSAWSGRGVFHLDPNDPRNGE